MEIEAVHGVNNYGSAGEPGGESAHQGRNRAVGVDEEKAFAANEAEELP